VRRVLVTGAGGSAGSNFVASLRLAAEPFYIVGADVSRYHIELADVDARYLLPPAEHPEYLDALNRLIERERIEFVHAQPDPEVALLARRRHAVAARTYLPDEQTVALCQDKALFANSLMAAGVATAEFVHPTTADELTQGAATLLERHDRAWIRAVHGAGARAALPVTRPEQALAWAQYWVDVRGLSFRDFMISEFLPGREFAFQSLWRRGKLVAAQTRERVEYLFGSLVPSGQTSTPSVARTVRRPDVVELAATAIRALDPNATGVFCADLKEDANDRPRLTEINAGRFFTTSNFFAVAGVNMPHDYVRLAFNEDVETRIEVLDEGLYWVRMVDMGFRLVREDEWRSSSA
jgi:ATP-grasp in the biosynthetic pathway with Ter operon